ncbi:hypothetical protein UT300005_10200 [Clostridium sp. CTA-5]
MSFSINNVCSKKSYINNITSEDRDKNAQELQKKKQIISEQDGKYCSTYVVDEEGHKVLLSKIPIAEMKKQNSLQNSNKYDNTNSCNYNMSKNFKCKQQLNMEATHRKNLQEIMDILKGNIDIKNNLNKCLDLTK